MIEPEDRATFIITENGERVGMFLLAYEAAQPWLVEFRRIVISSPGRGLGRFAVSWILDWTFNQLGAHRIWLEVVESNDRARRLYEAAGFVLEGTYRDGFRDEDGRYANLCFYGLLKTDTRKDATG
jgi:diamine N-acetyltransferase